MKVIVLLLALFGAVYGETCDGTDTTKCANEICLNNTVPTCSSGLCTCAAPPNPADCTTVSDCNSYWSGHHCSNNHRTCQNGKCACVHGHHG